VRKGAGLGGRILFVGDSSLQSKSASATEGARRRVEEGIACFFLREWATAFVSTSSALSLKREARTTSSAQAFEGVLGLTSSGAREVRRFDSVRARSESLVFAEVARQRLAQKSFVFVREDEVDGGLATGLVA
jgi:hypothetical protein